MLKQTLLHLEGKRKGKGLAIDFWTLIFWQFWNPLWIFKYAFLSCADTHTRAHVQDIFCSVLSQQTARIKLGQVLKHNDIWEEKEGKWKLLWKGGWGKATGIFALQVTSKQDYGKRLGEIQKVVATEEDQSSLCGHLFWSTINVSVKLRC